MEKGIVNPLNSNFAFLAENLPSNTPLKLNIYASNNRKRSLISVELYAKTLKPAQKLIDYKDSNNVKEQARGRKSSWLFEEFYSNYSRFRNKHIVLGFIISIITITVIIAIIFITISVLRSRNGQLGQRHRFLNEINHHLKLDDNNELIILNHDNDDMNQNENDKRDHTWQYKHKEKNEKNVLPCDQDNKFDNRMLVYQADTLTENDTDIGQLDPRLKSYVMNNDNCCTIRSNNEHSLSSYYKQVKEAKILESEKYLKTYHLSNNNNKAYFCSNKFFPNTALLSDNIYLDAQELATPDIIQTAIYSRQNVKCINEYEDKQYCCEKTSQY